MGWQCRSEGWCAVCGVRWGVGGGVVVPGGKARLRGKVRGWARTFRYPICKGFAGSVGAVTAVNVNLDWIVRAGNTRRKQTVTVTHARGGAGGRCQPYLLRWDASRPPGTSVGSMSGDRTQDRTERGDDGGRRGVSECVAAVAVRSADRRWSG